MKLEGVVTVYEAFSVFVEPVRIQIGEQTVTFKLDRRGAATTPEGQFRAKKAKNVGIVYGGKVEFEATLTGRSGCAS